MASTLHQRVESPNLRPPAGTTVKKFRWDLQVGPLVINEITGRRVAGVKKMRATQPTPEQPEWVVQMAASTEGFTNLSRAVKAAKEQVERWS